MKRSLGLLLAAALLAGLLTACSKEEKGPGKTQAPPHLLPLKCKPLPRSS